MRCFPQEKICDQSLPEPLLQIQITDKLEQPVAGVLVIVTWLGGEERFYTGLKPEQGPGYADYTIDPAIVYSLQIGENGAPVTDLSAAECESAAGDRFWGAWLLSFVQP